MKLATCNLLLFATLLAPRLALAQPAPSTPTMDRARTFLVLRLAEELGLSDEKALQVSSIMRKGEDHRRDLSAQREQVEKQLRTALEHKPLDDAELTKLIGQANDIDQQTSQVIEGSYRDIQKLLTVEQQAKLVLFRPQLQRQIRGALRRRLEGGGEQGGPRHRWRDDG